MTVFVKLEIKSVEAYDSSNQMHPVMLYVDKTSVAKKPTISLFRTPTLLCAQTIKQLASCKIGLMIFDTIAEAEITRKSLSGAFRLPVEMAEIHRAGACLLIDFTEGNASLFGLFRGDDCLEFISGRAHLVIQDMRCHRRHARLAFSFDYEHAKMVTLLTERDVLNRNPFGAAEALHALIEGDIAEAVVLRLLQKRMTQSIGGYPSIIEMTHDDLQEYMEDNLEEDLEGNFEPAELQTYFEASLASPEVRAGIMDLRELILQTSIDIAAGGKPLEAFICAGERHSVIS